MTAPDVVRFDRAIFAPAKLREIGKTAKGRRFMVDQRAKARFERDRLEHQTMAQLAEYDWLLQRLGEVLDGGGQ